MRHIHTNQTRKMNIFTVHQTDLNKDGSFTTDASNRLSVRYAKHLTEHKLDDRRNVFYKSSIPIVYFKDIECDIFFKEPFININKHDIGLRFINCTGHVNIIKDLEFQKLQINTSPEYKPIFEIQTGDVLKGHAIYNMLDIVLDNCMLKSIGVYDEKETSKITISRPCDHKSTVLEITNINIRRIGCYGDMDIKGITKAGHIHISNNNTITKLELLNVYFNLTIKSCNRLETIRVIEKDICNVYISDCNNDYGINLKSLNRIPLLDIKRSKNITINTDIVVLKIYDCINISIFNEFITLNTNSVLNYPTKIYNNTKRIILSDISIKDSKFPIFPCIEKIIIYTNNMTMSNSSRLIIKYEYDDDDDNQDLEPEVINMIKEAIEEDIQKEQENIKIYKEICVHNLESILEIPMHISRTIVNYAIKS